MLVPVQPAGTQPPLFIVHGGYGVMGIGRPMAQVLGPDQPLYGLNARGHDGLEPLCYTVPEMVQDYLAQIRRVWPSGPYLIGGMCDGAIVALEIARSLMAMGQSVGTVLFIDPPGMPISYNDRIHKLALSPSPMVNRQIYDLISRELLGYAARRHDLPFDARDPVQLDRATTVGIACKIAYCRHRLEPFSGATELIISEARGRGYFFPDLPWQKILVGPRTIHVLRGHHGEIYDALRDEVFRLVSFYLENALRETALVAPTAADGLAEPGPLETDWLAADNSS
jgi:thioesterase domain-containing protein